jgi:dihydroorotate dehydrogenase electron transfer subunit
MIRTSDACDPLLRRPLGIHRACYERETAKAKESRSCIEILYRIVGKGTLMLSTKQRGDAIDLLGPLGNGFSIDRNLKTAVLVAGGIGVAPLFSLAQALKERKSAIAGKTKLIAFLGGKTAADILCRRDLEKMGATVAVSTEDGSSGSKGMVTALLPRFFEDLPPVEERNLSLFACGPLPMLHTLSEFARSRKLPCQVSLESRMACGVGACVGCSIPTQSDESTLPTYQRACTEGPVFDSSIILWNDPHLSAPNG